MSWADFRGKLLGPTDPAAAPAGSLREQVYSKWEDLGRLASHWTRCEMVRDGEMWGLAFGQLVTKA